MSKAEVSLLIDWGKKWFKQVWVGDDANTRDGLIATVNAQLNGIGLKLGRGWRDYDPVIKPLAGKPARYLHIATWAAVQPNSGKAVAQQFLNWATDDTTLLRDLDDPLIELAVITHLAEVGRGYESSLSEHLYPFLQKIVAGTATWSEIRTAFPPALTYREDCQTEFSA